MCSPISSTNVLLTKMNKKHMHMVQNSVKTYLSPAPKETALRNKGKKSWRPVLFCSRCRVCLFISSVINNACHTCTDTFLFHICICSWFLLIRRKTTMLPLGDDSAHVCVSVIYWSELNSELVGHLKPLLMPLLEPRAGIHHMPLIYVQLLQTDTSTEQMIPCGQTTLSVPQTEEKWNIFMRGKGDRKKTNK